MSRSAVRAIASHLAVNMAIAAVAGVFLAIANGATSLSDMAVSVGISAVYANLIGIPISLSFSYIRPRVHTWPPLAQWCVLIGLLLAIVIVACLIAGVLFVWWGIFPARAYWQSFGYGLRIALAVGAICTAGGVAYDRLRERLSASELGRERALTLAAEAKLASLAARVHPHFLFNSLNSVACLIHEDPSRAETLLGRLATILRFSLDAEARSLVALEDEIAIVRDYLDLEAARLGDRLRSDISLDGTARTCKVPPLAVQVLVENSVLHAIASRRRGGAIEITARQIDDAIEIEVWDDGPGFSDGALKAGHGLDNVRGRLSSLFGADGKLSIARCRGGMSVTLSVPAT